MNIADLFPQQRRNTHAVLANAETGQSFPDWLRRQMGQLRALGSAQGAGGGGRGRRRTPARCCDFARRRLYAGDPGRARLAGALQAAAIGYGTTGRPIKFSPRCRGRAYWHVLAVRRVPACNTQSFATTMKK